MIAQKWVQTLKALFFAGLAVVVVALKHTTSDYEPSSALITVLAAAYTLSRMLFPSVLVLSTFITVGFQIWLGVVSDLEWTDQMANSLSLWGAFVIGAIGVFLAERQQRKNFLKARYLLKRRERLHVERGKTEKLLVSILPASVAERIKKEKKHFSERYSNVTTLFAKLDGRTLQECTSATQTVDLLNDVFRLFDRRAKKQGCEKVKTIASVYMVSCGLPIPSYTSTASRVAQLALDMREIVLQYSEEKGYDLELTMGMHEGNVVAGVVGLRAFCFDCWGDSVNTASRMYSTCPPGRIQMTADMKEKLCDDYIFEFRGPVFVKGKGQLTTFFLIGPRTASSTTIQLDSPKTKSGISASIGAGIGVDSDQRLGPASRAAIRGPSSALAAGCGSVLGVGGVPLSSQGYVDGATSSSLGRIWGSIKDAREAERRRLHSATLTALYLLPKVPFSWPRLAFRFDSDEDEGQFRRESGRRTTLWSIRASLFSGVLVELVMFFTEVLSLRGPEYSPVVYGIRSGIVLAIILAIVLTWVTRINSILFRTYLPESGAAISLMVGVGASTLWLLLPNAITIHVNALLHVALMYTYVFVGMRVRYATIVCFVLTLLTVVLAGVLEFDRFGAIRLGTIAVFLVTNSAIGVYSTWITERQQRINHLLDRDTEAMMFKIKQEEMKSDRLLLACVPKPIADELREETGRTVAQSHESVSLLFADIVGFTRMSSGLTPVEVVAILNQLFSEFDVLAARYGVEKIKTLGDCYVAAGGLPKPMKGHAEAVVRMGLAMVKVIRELNRQRPLGVNLRIGVHSGPVVAGVIGEWKFLYDAWGETVEEANFMESSGQPGKVQISAATRELVGEVFDLDVKHNEDGSLGSSFWVHGLRGEGTALAQGAGSSELVKLMNKAKQVAVEPVSPPAGPPPFSRPSLLKDVDVTHRIPLDCPHGIAVWGDQLYAADWKAGTVTVFALGYSIEPLRTMGAGILLHPSALAVASDGAVYVCDWGHDRIVVFDGDGEVVREMGQRGRSPGSVRGPMGVAVSGSKLAISDTNNHRVQVWTTEGEVLDILHTVQGRRLHYPSAVAISGSRIIVSDTFNNRVVQWDDMAASVVGTLRYPSGLALSGDVLWVTERESGRVYSRGTDWVLELDSLQEPRGLALWNGSVLVSDSADGCVIVNSIANSAMEAFFAELSRVVELHQPSKPLQFAHGCVEMLKADSVGVIDWSVWASKLGGAAEWLK